MLILTPKAILNSNDLTANNELHVNGYRFYSYHQTLLFEPYQPRKHIPLDCNGSTRTSAIVMGTNQDHSHSFIPWQQKHYINPSNAMRCSHALYNTDAAEHHDRSNQRCISCLSELAAHCRQCSIINFSRKRQAILAPSPSPFTIKPHADDGYTILSIISLISLYTFPAHFHGRFGG